jgi:hypothetical protein
VSEECEGGSTQHTVHSAKREKGPVYMEHTEPSHLHVTGSDYF